jgi:hypothetical protein
MKIATIDTKRRLVLPGAQPGETYAVRQAEAGHYELTKVIPAPKKKPSARTIDALMQSAALTPRLNSAQLRAITREP